jgi:stage II sporulation protein M
VLWWVLLGLGLLVFALVRMGVQLFNREELLGRDLDEINLRAAWATFSAAYAGSGRARGLLNWYRTEVFPTLRRLSVPVMVLCLALAAAFAIGYAYAPLYPLPLSAEQLRETTVEFSARVAQFGLSSPTGSAWILLVNVRALLIATLMGTFSAGVLGVILLMAPLGLVGYFAGQMSLIGVNPLWFVVAFILPHGVFEIPAAILEGAAILRLGASVLAPPPGKTLGEGWLLGLADWAKISLALVVPLLILAALAEALLTPLVVQAIFGGL